MGGGGGGVETYYSVKLNFKLNNIEVKTGDKTIRADSDHKEFSKFNISFH